MGTSRCSTWKVPRSVHRRQLDEFICKVADENKWVRRFRRPGCGGQACWCARRFGSSIGKFEAKTHAVLVGTLVVGCRYCCSCQSWDGPVESWASTPLISKDRSTYRRYMGRPVCSWRMNRRLVSPWQASRRRRMVSRS